MTEDAQDALIAQYLREAGVQAKELNEALADVRKVLRSMPPKPRMKLPDYFQGSSDHIPGRADTDEKKGDMLARLWDAWSKMPDMRLGQIIYNAVAAEMKANGRNVSDVDEMFFYTEDGTLAELVEKYVKGGKDDT